MTGPPGIAHIDGQYMPVAEARLPVLDFGFLHSDATYDVAHVWDGSFFRLEDHLDRFLAGVAGLHMSLPTGRDGLRRVLIECVRRSGLTRAYVEMICTRGVSPTFSRDPRECVNRFIAFAIPFGWIADEEQRARGLKAVISPVRRIPPDSVDPRIKNYHWLDFVTGLYGAYAQGGETVILTDGRGNVTEGPGFNVFAVRDGEIITPDSGVLEGITRRTVLELAPELNLTARTGRLPVSELQQAEEVFITSTAGGIMAVGTMDGRPVGESAPGPVTAALTDLYWAGHTDPAWSTPVQYE